MKKIIIIFVALIAVILVSLFFVPRLINWNSYITAKVKESTGRELSISGDIRLSLLPSISFSASDIHLSNAPGMAESDMISVRAVSGKVRLWPLLSRRVVIDSFIITGPSVHLEVDKTGRQNWVFEMKEQVSLETEDEPSEGKAGLPIKGLSLGDVRFEEGQFSFVNAITGQAIKGSDINMVVALQNLGSPFSLTLRLILNNEPVTLDVLVDSFQNIQVGTPVKVKSVLDTRFIKQKPVPGLDGRFNLDVPSVGKLAAWLDQPLKASQPDPGPLKIRAIFSGDGAKVALKEATIEGKALKAIATGSYDGSGDITKVILNVESGILDIDQYLPPVPVGKKKTALPKKKRTAPSGNPLAALSDEPFDLTGLMKTEANVKINIRGIKAMGYEIGQVAFSTILKNGLLTADLTKLALYGGSVKGTFRLDGSGKALDVDTKLNIADVKVDRLARAATSGELPVTGIANGTLNATARGSSPRTMVESLKGRITFNLGGVDIKDAPVGAISDVKVDADLPGLEHAPTLKGSVVYNKKRVKLDLTLDPLKKVISGDTFALKAVVESKLLTAGYDGKVQQKPVPGLDGRLQKPVPGLDGRFNLDVPSVGKLAAWLDQPLKASQPDPGPLKIRAIFSGDGAKVALKEATIEGKALKAIATGSYDGTKRVPYVSAKVNVVSADLNAYLPKSEPKKKVESKKKVQPKKEEASGWSEEPLDLSALAKANGEVEVKIDSLQYGDITINPGLMKALLNNGVLKASIDELKVAGGTITSTVKLDSSGQAASMDYQVSISGVEARPLLKTFAKNDRLSGKTEFQTKGSAKGRNQKELVSSLNGDGEFKFADGAIHGVNIAATLRKAKSLGFDKGGTNEALNTDFAELSGSFVIRNGRFENQDFKMLAPLLRLNGGGVVPLPGRTVDYNVNAVLVATLEGQGGKDAMAGLPIPIKIKGPWDDVSYGVEWKSVFNNISADPERLKNLPKNLRDASKSFGVDLSLPKLPGKDIGLETLDKILLPKKKSPDEPAESTTTKEPDEKEEPTPLEPLKTIKDLFGK
jgi:AsmA protein